MKKLSFIAVAAIAVLLFACGGKNKSKMVVGDWKIADMNVPMPPNVPDSLKQKYDSAFKAQVEMMKKSSTFNYKEDGTYSYNFVGQQGGGQWKTNEDCSEITLTEGGKSDVSKIKELTDNKMVIESNNPNGGSMTLTLAK